MNYGFIVKVNKSQKHFSRNSKVRVRVQSSKYEVRCASACETITKVRVCVRHTVKFLATQRLMRLVAEMLYVGSLEKLFC